MRNVKPEKFIFTLIKFDDIILNSVTTKYVTSNIIVQELK